VNLVENSLALAREVDRVCVEEGCEVLLIGAMALAAHGYPRNTEDVDFAIAIDPRKLPALAHRLERLGLEATLAEADAQDPLGGVITLRRDGALPIQLVNFDNFPAGGFPKLVQDALSRASIVEGGIGKLPTVEDLILFKVYAGGPKSTLDILELLTRTQVDLNQLRERAHGYGMKRDLAQVLALAGRPKDSS
jgi:hypothetical protein